MDHNGESASFPMYDFPRPPPTPPETQVDQSVTNPVDGSQCDKPRDCHTPVYAHLWYKTCTCPSVWCHPPTVVPLRWREELKNDASRSSHRCRSCPRLERRSNCPLDSSSSSCSTAGSPGNTPQHATRGRGAKEATL